MPHAHQIDPVMQECITNCQNCHAACLQMLASHCLEVGGKHVAADHVKLILDCVQICQTSADFMLRGSAHHAHICRECAEICEACAKSCEEVGDMDDCVQACRACAQSCAQMGRMASDTVAS